MKIKERRVRPWFTAPSFHIIREGKGRSYGGLKESAFPPWISFSNVIKKNVVLESSLETCRRRCQQNGLMSPGKSDFWSFEK